jgi:hypothetical protein
MMPFSLGIHLGAHQAFPSELSVESDSSHTESFVLGNLLPDVPRQKKHTHNNGHECFNIKAETWEKLHTSISIFFTCISQSSHSTNL